ncbi:TIGR02646 family protein [Chrysosporum bergii ANA360D]|jgi:uncharacterized protein (TIGR02646 family)|uniref:TIGR02646 family protein n=1 Tax=Chrysosporum bergii ANA360D TaxID=617107 RepID=A0AA43KCK3_9CYAN|nr:retron system putative HNH endonuclease [Chrysosporum bergii]MDH6061526.1 TIGR02646 family protein [Chrysosporum bergii ANA360D]
MKYIKKNQEPKEFSSWKALKNDDWKPSWDDNFQAPQKPVVHDALLQEQGFICCYCGMAITRATSHIEHLQPRSSHPHLALQYINLVASCQGESDEPPPVPVHCGHKKDNWYDEQLLVSPLIPNCAEFFRYPASGEILPTDDPDKKAAAETTIEKLALNIAKLQNMRKLALDAALLGIEDLTDAQIQQLAQHYDQPDSHGQYTPFCQAIAYILRQFI